MLIVVCCTVGIATTLTAVAVQIIETSTLAVINAVHFLTKV